MTPRVILHADMDAFYAAIEQRDRPELRGLPIVVGGKGGRGVVAAASYEARVFGIHSAMPSVEARRRCPDLIFLPGDMAKYGRESRRIFAIFERFSPDVEPLSLDEAFIDVGPCLRALAAPPLEIGRRLKAEVLNETGLRVSVGIAPVKMVAKIASDLSKPDGLLEVHAHEVRDFLAPLPIARLWGVGPVTEQALEKIGLRTIGALAALDTAGLAERAACAARLRGGIGGSALVRLWRLARGEDERDVEADRDARSYGEENTFATDVADLRTLGDAIGEHAEAVARRLRHDGVAGTVVRLKIKSTERLAQPGKYRLYSRQETLPDPTDDGALIARTARELLARGDLPLPVRLVGVAVGGIRATAASIGDQMTIFGPPRSRDLNRALDAITDRFGVGAVRRGAGGAEKQAPTLGVKRGEQVPTSRVKQAQPAPTLGARRPE